MAIPPPMRPAPRTLQHRFTCVNTYLKICFSWSLGCSKWFSRWCSRLFRNMPVGQNWAHYTNWLQHESDWTNRLENCTKYTNRLTTLRISASWFTNSTIRETNRKVGWRFKVIQQCAWKRGPIDIMQIDDFYELDKLTIWTNWNSWQVVKLHKSAELTVSEMFKHGTNWMTWAHVWIWKMLKNCTMDELTNLTTDLW